MRMFFPSGVMSIRSIRRFNFKFFIRNSNSFLCPLSWLNVFFFINFLLIANKLQIFKIISKEDISGFIIQPTTNFSEPTLEQLLVFYDNVYPYYDEVRVVPQLHKIISAP